MRRAAGQPPVVRAALRAALPAPAPGAFIAPPSPRRLRPRGSRVPLGRPTLVAGPTPPSCPLFPHPAACPPLPSQGPFRLTQHSYPPTPTPAVSSSSSEPLRFSLDVCPPLARLLLCRVISETTVESSELVSGYGNTLHNASGGEPDDFPYAVSLQSSL